MLRKRFLSLLAALLVVSGSVWTLPRACAEAGAQSKMDDAAKDRPKVVLALGGGGTRGAAHVGVLKVLEKEGIPIHHIVGTSMGAVVGGLYAAGVPVSTLEEKFRDRSLMEAFMTVPLWMRLVAAPLLITPRLVGSRPYDGLYWGNKFRKYVERSVAADKQEIENLNIDFSAVVLNVLDCKPVRISSGSLGYALQASSAVPGLRKPVEIGDGLYVDGGVVANVPVKLAREAGADVVIAVSVDERVHPQAKDVFRKVGSISRRMVTFELAFQDELQIRSADVLIHPNVDGISLISTKRDDAVRAMKAGEEAAQAAVPSIKAKLAAAGAAVAHPEQGQTEVHGTRLEPVP